MVLAEMKGFGWFWGGNPPKLTNHNDLTNNNTTLAGCRLKVLAVKGSKFATAGPWESPSSKQEDDLVLF